MLSLRELQKQFKQSVLEENNHLLQDMVKANGLDAYRRLQVYRNNYFVSLTEALERIYPCIKTLVGERFFTSAAKAYIRNHPSRSGDISQFGQYFSSFLAEFPPAKTIPYLPEMAEFEWACHCAFYEKAIEAQCLQKLEQIAEQQYGQMILTLAPSCHLLSFQYPILRIWQFCQASSDSDEPLHIDNDIEYILVIQKQKNVHFENLSQGEYHLLSAFKKDKPLDEACELAYEADPECEVDSLLQKHLLAETVIDISL